MAAPLAGLFMLRLPPRILKMEEFQKGGGPGRGLVRVRSFGGGGWDLVGGKFGGGGST